jgi:hypothetical protein
VSCTRRRSPHCDKWDSHKLKMRALGEQCGLNHCLTGFRCSALVAMGGNVDAAVGVLLNQK